MHLSKKATIKDTYYYSFHTNMHTLNPTISTKIGA